MGAFWVRVSGGLFLLLQAVLLQTLWRTNSDDGTVFTIFLVFSIITVVAGLAAIGFFWLNQSGWLLAMFVQGACLFVALVIYFVGLWPVLAQLTMLYSIFMVLYLNSYFVRSVFRPESGGRDIPGENP